MRLPLEPRVRLVVWAVAAGAAGAPLVRSNPRESLAALLAGVALARGRGVLLLAVAAVALGGAVGALRLAAIDAPPPAGLIGRPLRGIVEIDGAWRGTRLRHADGMLITPRSLPVLVRIGPGTSAPPRGARLAFEGALALPSPARAGYDERADLARRGIHAVLRLQRFAPAGSRGGLLGLSDGLRRRALQALAHAGSDDRGRLVAALALGADDELSPSARADFRAAGLAHLLAVSGQNIALVVAAVVACALGAGLHRRTAVWIALPAILLYVLVVGPSPAVLRAGIAGALGCAAWLISRPSDRWHALGLALALLLAWNPRWLGDPGLQLSFAAVAAIHGPARTLERVLRGTPLPLPGPVAIAAACTAATLPISLWHFGSAGVVAAVPANVLAEPAVAPILWLGLAAAAVDPVAPAAATLIARLARAPAAWILLIARLGAALEQAALGRRIAIAAAVVAMAAGMLALRSRRAGEGVSSAAWRSRRSSPRT